MIQHNFKAGMYLLETLTSGMYNEPLSIYREYIQNAVDAIDQAKLPAGKGLIQIELDPFDKSVTISDNGSGLSENSARSILSSIGGSPKIGTDQRGFRGIGRLGGIAFAKTVLFKTTAAGESTVSSQVWDCLKLSDILDSPEHSSLSIEEVFHKVTHFSQEDSPETKDISYFEVQLLGVESFRNHIFDIQRIKRYLQQVAPLPFDQENFSFHKNISSFLYQNVPNYSEYTITINGEPLYRPYKNDIFITSKKGIDRIVDIEYVTISSQDSIIANAWYGRRQNLLGSIRRGEDVSGLRVKVGNIQIGGQHLLDHCFRENRFNSYIVGEIHVCNKALLPNSRRDDFVDNNYKALLYNSIEKEIGLPLSKEIRKRSRLNLELQSKVQPKALNSDLKTISKAENSAPDESLTPSFSPSNSYNIVKQLLKQCGDCDNLKKILQDFSN